MGLRTILRKQRLREHEMRLLLLGLDNAGKTTIVKRISGEPVDTISPTLGFHIQTLEYAPASSRDNDSAASTSSTYRLNIWDVGGQRTIRSYWRNYFEKTDGVIWVVDSADVQRLSDCKQELHSLLKEERLAGAALLILANKQDIEGALSCDQLSQVLELDKIAASMHHWAIYPCSALKGDKQSDIGAKLLEGIDWLVTDISSSIFFAE
ncbi:putative ADP-ribosylation factor domain-containing protein [Ramicandelaber brevisporus]|nr:putative ADP-ribosylation factor domain-containing protein [Ramicandelaber brevisporus]